MYVPTAPSVVMRDAFLAADAMPFLRSTITACSISPLASVSAPRQSIMGAPVLSRSSLTWAAEIFSVTVDIFLLQFYSVQLRFAAPSHELSSDLHLGSEHA